jgi:SAM-dependent methyltransferase
MINWLHSLVHDPRKGWDPIPLAYARDYADGQVADPEVVKQFAAQLGGFNGKEVVDLGSGPGHYALEFVRLGARVTCVDVSKVYLEMARSRIEDAGFRAQYVAGYMDWIDRLLGREVDAIFTNVSWRYCFDDFSFARHLLRALRVRGILFVRESNEGATVNGGGHPPLTCWLNRSVGLKLGHPRPPRGRIEKALRKAGGTIVEVLCTDGVVETVIATKPLTTVR